MKIEKSLSKININLHLTIKLASENKKHPLNPFEIMGVLLELITYNLCFNSVAMTS